MGMNPFFADLDDRISFTHIDAWFLVAETYAQNVIAASSGLSLLVGSCRGDSLNESCVRSLVQDWGLKILRRPVESTEVDELYSLFSQVHALESGVQADVLAYQTLLTKLLMFPDFYYHLYKDGSESNLGYTLSAYELASKLSFALLGSTPPEDLLELAESGQILNTEVYESFIKSVFSGQKYAEKFEQRMMRLLLTWLRPYGVAPINTDHPAYELFLDGLPLEGRESELQQAAQEEIEQLALYHFMNAESVDELLLTRKSFSQDSLLAQIYGPTDQNGNYLDEARSGFLTRAGFLMSGGVETNPIIKGAFIREYLLCQDLGTPPANITEEAPEIDETSSQRDRVTAMTSAPDCAGCHSMINPLGFSLESFDSLGRKRSFESVFDRQSGEELAVHAINARARPLAGIVDEEVNGAREMSEHIARGGKASACFTRRIFQALGRSLSETDADSCIMRTMATALEPGGGGMKEVVRQFVLHPRFKQRGGGQ